MSRKKLFVRIGLGVAGALLLVGCMLAARAVGDGNLMRQGIEEGFELRGTYQSEPAAEGAVTFTFETSDGQNSWVATRMPEESATGSIRETVDPNLYVLEGKNGEEAGWAHLAYADREGAGTLYVRYGESDVVELHKVSRVPGYLVHD